MSAKSGDTLPPLKQYSNLTINRLGLNKGSLRNAYQHRKNDKAEEEIIKKKINSYYGARLEEKGGQTRPWM